MPSVTLSAVPGKTCSFLSEILGDRDGSPVWALLSRGMVVRRQVSEPGESLDEDLVVRFLVTMWKIRERQRTLLATQGINIPNARAPGIDVLFFPKALMGNFFP